MSLFCFLSFRFFFFEHANYVVWYFSVELECQPSDVFVSMWSYHVLCNPMWDGPFQWYDTKIKNAFSRSFNHS